MAKTVVVCEVLRFVRQYFDKLPTADLKPALTNFYNEEELVIAKDVMIQAVLRAAKDRVIDLKLPRLPKRQKCRQVVEDLIKLFTIFDERKLTDALARFVAEDLSRVPSINPDSINMLAMAKRVEALESRMKLMEQSMTDGAGCQCKQ